jgi:hypothetical protein
MDQTTGATTLPSNSAAEVKRTNSTALTGLGPAAEDSRLDNPCT